MGARRMRIGAPCPACHAQTVDYTAAELNIPYFDDVVQTVFICSTCGFHHADVIAGRVRAPKRYVYRMTKEDDMMIRVVRSTSGTVRIPELGVLIEPGPASEAFVSNIEGVLVRVEAVLRQLQRDADTPQQRRACEDRLAQIQRVREGRLPATLVLEDPFGNSVIAHADATVEAIPQKEADEMPRGETTFDMTNMRRDEPRAGDGHQRPGAP